MTSKVREQHFLAMGFVEMLVRSFRSHENRIDLREHIGIVKGHRPSRLTRIVLTQNAEAPLRPPSIFDPKQRDIAFLAWQRLGLFTKPSETPSQSPKRNVVLPMLTNSARLPLHDFLAPARFLPPPFPQKNCA